MSENDVDEFAMFLRERRLAEGEALFREGDEGGSLFVLLRGEVVVDLSGPGGELLRVARLVPGDVLGEQSCLDPAPRSATVTAITDAFCLELTRAELDRMAVECPRLASHLLGVILHELTVRLRAVDRRISAALAGESAMPPSQTQTPAPSRPSQRPPPLRPSQPPPRPSQTNLPPLQPPPPSAWDRLRARFGGE